MRDDLNLLSRPVRLHWAGWETTTHKLQQHGWQISAEQDVMRMQMMLAMRSPNGEAHAVSSRVNWDYHERSRFEGFAPIDLGADIRFGREIMFNHYGELPRFQAVDALPQMTEQRRTKLSDFAHFAPAPLVRNNPIVIPEENVADLMARILELQQPDRTARIQAALRNPEGYMLDSLPKQKFHAQILSFAA